MKSLLATIPLLMVWTGCGQGSSLEVTSVGITAMVKGSPDLPFVSASGEENADQVLVVSATHVDSGEVLDSEIWVRKAGDEEWVEFPALDGSSEGKHVYFTDSVGVDVSFTYSVEMDGKESVQDEAQVLIPFGKNQSGREGAFKYEANWKQS